jgi:hypothetical protein
MGKLDFWVLLTISPPSGQALVMMFDILLTTSCLVDFVRAHLFENLFAIALIPSFSCRPLMFSGALIIQALLGEKF